MDIKKNIIFPIEFDHLEGGMIKSVISLAKFLVTDFNVFFLAYKNAEILNIDERINNLILQNPWSISISAPIKTCKTYLEVRGLLDKFEKENTFIFTNNVGSELIFSGFGFFPLPFKRVFVSRGGSYKGKTGWFLKKGFRSVHRFVAISENQKDILMKIGIEESLITKIHNGVPVNEFYTNNKDSSIKNLSIVGYINANKNQILGIEALSELLKFYPELKLNIYGVAFSESDKLYKDKLNKRIIELGLSNNVIFNGFETDQSIIFANTDILISTSLSEGFGRSVAEAMGHEVACVGLATSGGLLDIITNNFDGILIEGKKSELVNALKKLIEDDAFRKKIISNALMTYNTRFTEEIMCNNYLKFLKENLK